MPQLPVLWQPQQVAAQPQVATIVQPLPESAPCIQMPHIFRRHVEHHTHEHPAMNVINEQVMLVQHGFAIASLCRNASARGQCPSFDEPTALLTQIQHTCGTTGGMHASSQRLLTRCIRDTLKNWQKAHFRYTNLRKGPSPYLNFSALSQRWAISGKRRSTRDR